MRYIVLVLVFIVFAPVAEASQSQGTILAGSNLTKICQDVTCTIHGNVNWKPTINANTPGATAVSITDTALTGMLWGDEIGWVNLNPQNGGVTVNPSTGALSGYAFTNTGSWINFRPTQNAGNPNVGVVIDASGQLSGYAYVSGIKGGWMKFDCTDPSTCIKTDWRSIPNRSQLNSTGGGGGGGGGFVGSVPTATSVIPTTPTIKPNTPAVNEPVLSRIVTGERGTSGKSNIPDNVDAVAPSPVSSDISTTSEHTSTQISKKIRSKFTNALNVIKQTSVKAWVFVKPSISTWYNFCTSLATYFQNFISFFNLPITPV